MPDAGNAPEGQATAPPTETTTATNPGAAAGYTPATGTVSSGFFSGLTVPGNSLGPDVPSGAVGDDFDTLDLPNFVGGSPASQHYTEAPVDAPDVARLSADVKAITALAQTGSTPAELTAKKLGLPGGGVVPNPEDFPPRPQMNAQIAALWEDAMTQLRHLGVSVHAYDDLKKAPTAANAVAKLKLLGRVSLSESSKSTLHAAGYVTDGLNNVQQLVEGHDAGRQQEVIHYTPAKGGSWGTQSAGNAYQSFVDNWNSSKTYRKKITDELAASGLLNISANESPTSKQVASTYAQAIRSAAEQHQSIGRYLSDQEQAASLSGLTGTSATQQYVIHQADELVGPGILTPQQAAVIATLANQNGTSSGPDQDLINAQILQAYSNYVGGLGKDPTQAQVIPSGGGSFAGMAYNDIADGLAQQYGIVASPYAIAQFVDGTGQTNQLITEQQALAQNVPPASTEATLQTGVDTPYQLSTIAQSIVEAYAKQNAASHYSAPVATAINQGSTLQSLAQPYLNTLSSLTGIPAAELLLSDPANTAWETGGTMDGGQMTQQEWAQHIVQNDPRYQGSQTQRDVQSTDAAVVLGMMGQLPGAPTTFAAPTAAAPSSGGTGAPAV